MEFHNMGSLSISYSAGSRTGEYLESKTLLNAWGTASADRLFSGLHQRPMPGKVVS